MQRALFSILISAMMLLGGTVAAQEPDITEEELIQFENWFEDIAGVVDNSNLREIPINSDAEEDEFIGIIFAAYAGYINEEQFIFEMDQSFPGYADSVSGLAAIVYDHLDHGLTAQDKEFLAWHDLLTVKIENKSDYRRIPINSEAQVQEFTGLLYQAYYKEISKRDFIRTVSKIYPGHESSITWIANQLP